MKYVDGYLVPVENSKKAAYEELAKEVLEQYKSGVAA